MEKEKLLQELKKEFDMTKSRLKFKTTFEEINSISYLEDFILSTGYVSNQFSRQLINRILETPYGWLSELHNWFLPSPNNLITVTEGKTVTAEEKKEISGMIDKIMYFVRKNKRIAFEGLKKGEEGALIDEIADFNKNEFVPFMLRYNLKFEKVWKEQLKK